MMIETSHFFNGIEERSHVFIPLEFKHQRDTRPMWGTAFFSYLEGVWEWVQVTGDHIANHYTLLAHAYAAEKASTPTHAQVSSIAPLTKCSLAITVPSAQLSHKGGATTHPKGSIRNVKVHPGSSDPPGVWTTWEEYMGGDNLQRFSRSPGGHSQSNCRLYQPLSHQSDNSVFSSSACSAGPQACLMCW